MAELPPKRDVLIALREQVDHDLAVITESQRKAQEGATHEEAKSEGDKDMRATETSYVARGLAKRVSELRTAASKLATMVVRRFGDDDPVEIGALVGLEDEEDEDGDLLCYFLAPAGGGLKVTVEGVVVRVITPAAPLGTALLGKHLDDDVELSTPGGTRSLTLVALA